MLPALDQRLRSEILAIQVQQIECIDRELTSLAAECSFEQSEKVRRTVGARKAQFRVQDCGMGRDGAQRIRQGRQALAPVMPAAAVEAHHAAFLGNLQAVAVQLGLVQPVVASWHGLGGHGVARRDEMELGHSFRM